MANTSKAKDFEFPLMITEFAGYNSASDKTNLPPNFLVRGSKNVYKKLSGTIAVRQGQKRQGAANSALSPCSSEFVWNTSWGAILPLVVANSNLWVIYNDVWYSLLSGVTDTRYVFDKWWDNTEKKDRVLMVNGNNYIQHWSGGIAMVLSSTANTITKSGSESWQQAGFATNTGAEKKIMINGVEYTYTGGESTTTLTGVSPSAAAIVPGTIAIQSVITASSTPSASFANDFIKVINNQAYVGSYVSRLIYISDDSDFTNYVVPTPRLPGSPELLTLDGAGKGIGVRQGNPHIGFGTGNWAVVTYTDITVGTTLTQQTTVSVKPVAHLAGPYAHEFIDTVGDTLVYLSQDQQVRTYGDFSNLFTPAYPSLSQQISLELMEQDFTGGALKCIADFTYLTVPNTGSVYLYQVRQSIDASGQVVAERLWHPPFVWNATRIDEINGTIVAYSNANPQIYEVWDTGQYFDDSPSDEALPYECVMALSYRDLNRRQGLNSFNKNFSEGYITAGTTLTATIYYNYQGSLNIVPCIVNSPDQPGYTFSGNDDPSSLGDVSLGDESLGSDDEGGNSQDSLLKFKVINSVPIINNFEYQVVYSSNEVNAQWEVLATATNATVETEQDATFIINKVRN